jgi:hypothetical protein
VGVADEKYLICDDGRVIRITRQPRPYCPVNEYQADGSLVFKEFGAKPKACDSEKR